MAMTRYEQGFMRKCAEHRIGAYDAGLLLKLAQLQPPSSPAPATAPAQSAAPAVPAFWASAVKRPDSMWLPPKYQIGEVPSPSPAQPAAPKASPSPPPPAASKADEGYAAWKERNQRVFQQMFRKSDGTMDQEAAKAFYRNNPDFFTGGDEYRRMAMQNHMRSMSPDDRARFMGSADVQSYRKAQAQRYSQQAAAEAKARYAKGVKAYDASMPSFRSADIAGGGRVTWVDPRTGRAFSATSDQIRQAGGVNAYAGQYAHRALGRGGRNTGISYVGRDGVRRDFRG